MDDEEEAELAVDNAVEVEAAVRAKNQATQDQLREQNARVQGLLQQAREDAAEAVAATKAPREGSRTPRRKKAGPDGVTFGPPLEAKQADQAADAKTTVPADKDKPTPPGGAR